MPHGYSGMLLKSRVAQAFVIANPYPRVLSFSTARCPSPFYIAPMKYLALRAWFMEPVQTAKAGLPAALPGCVVIHEPPCAHRGRAANAAQTKPCGLATRLLPSL